MIPRGVQIAAIVAGMAYCAVIGACINVLDLSRAREWTSALTTWCDGQPGLVPYRGQCLVHRAQIKMLQGAWSDAFDETLSACEILRDPFIADAYYLLGELHRLDQLRGVDLLVGGVDADHRHAAPLPLAPGAEPLRGVSGRRLGRCALSPSTTGH